MTFLSGRSPARPASPKRIRIGKSSRLGLEALEDRTLLQGSPLVINGNQNMPNQFRLVRDATNSALLDVFVNNNTTTPTSQVTFAGISQIQVNGLSSNNALTLDLSNGTVIPSGGLTYDGGTGSNSLTINGGSFDRDTYTYSNSQNGTIQLGTFNPLITYLHLASVTNTGTVSNTLYFNLPSGGVGATLQDDGTLGNNLSQLVSTNATFVTTTFADPSGSFAGLIINSGAGGASTFTTAANFSGDFHAALTINGISTTDTVTLNALTLNTGTGLLLVSAKTININGVVDNTGPLPSEVELIAGGAITEGPGGAIKTNVLQTQSVSGTALGGSNAVSTFGYLSTSNDTSGDITLNNTASLLSLNAISNSGGGSITVTNTGAISLGTLGLSAASGGNISLTASGDLTLPAGGSVNAGGAVTLTGGLGSAGGTVTINGAVIGASVSIRGGSGTNTFNINPDSSSSAMSIGGGTGSNTFKVTPNTNATLAVHGGIPPSPAHPNNTLTVLLAGTTNPQLTLTSVSFNGVAGQWTFGNRQPVSFDTIQSLNQATTLTSINRLTPSGPNTNASSVTFQATFSQAVTGVTASNFALSGTASGAGTIGTPTSSDNVHWSIPVTGLSSANGTLELDLANNTGIVDQSNNPLFTTTLSGQSYTLDHAAPTVSISAPSSSMTTTGPVTYTVTYADPDFQSSMLSTTNVHLNVTGNANGMLSFDNSNGSTRTITISSITGNGTLGISIDAGSASDQAGNLAPAAGPSATFTVNNNSGPTVTISAPSKAITNTGPVTYTVTYTSANFQSSTLSTTNVHLNTTGNASGTLGFDNSSGSTRTITISGISGNGTLGISIDAGSAIDQNGNQALAAGPSATFIVDNTQPTVMIGAPSLSNTNTGPVTYTVTYTDADFQSSTLSTTNVHLNATGTATGTLSFDNSTGATRTITISGITGSGTLGISIDAGSASDQAGNLAPAAGPSTTFVVDNTPVTVTISTPSKSFATAGTVTYTITYTDDDFQSSMLSTANVHLDASGTASGTLSFDNSTGATRTVTINNLSGTGTLGISIDAGSASDQAGNLAPAAGPSATFLVSAGVATGPILNSINRLSPSGQFTNASSVTFQATFSKAVTGVKASNFALSGTAGVSNNNIGMPSTSDNVHWSIPVTGLGSANGTLELDLANSTGITGQSGGSLVTTTFSGQSYTLDHVAPTVSISAPSQSSTSTGPVTYTVTYTDADFQSSMLSTTNVHLNATGSAAGSLSFDNGSGATRTITISSITGNGTLGISIDAGSASDQAGNQAPAAGPSATFTVNNNSGPTVTISTPSKAITNTGPVTYTVTYTSASFKSSTLSTTNVHLNATGNASGTLSFDNSTGATRTITISSIAGNGALGISIDAGSAVDQNGNQAPAAGPSATFTVDNTQPALMISAPSKSITNTGPVTYTVTYTDADFQSSMLSTSNVHFNATGTASGTLSFDNSSGATRTITISGITGNGTLGISIDASSGVDQAGNLAPAAGPSTTFTVDNTQPTVSMSSSAPNPTQAASITVTVTVSKPTTDFTANALVVGNGTASNFMGSGTSYTFTLAPTTLGTATTVDIPANAFHDAAGNGNVAAPRFSRTFQSAGVTIAVQSFKINPFDSTNQRSMVTTLQVTFNTLITFDAGAFTLAGDNNVVLNPVDTTPSGGTSTVVTITFTGSTIIGHSLADGRYSLTVHGANIHAGASTMATDQVFSFFRLFGDATGDGKVDNTDLNIFYGVFYGNPLYTQYRFAFDYYADGKVDQDDWAQFFLRYGKSLP